MRSISVFSIAAALLVCSAFVLAEEDATGPSDVVILTDANFEQLTKQGAWLLEFYAPWCGHCKRLAPTWEQVATKLKSQGVSVGKVDCTVESTVARQFGIRGFPTLKLLKGGEVYEYKGDRSLESLIEFATGGYVTAAAASVPAKPSQFEGIMSDVADAFRIIERVAKDKVWYALGVAFVFGLLLGAVIFGGSYEMPPPAAVARAASNASSSSSSSSGSPSFATPHAAAPGNSAPSAAAVDNKKDQ